MRGKRNCESCRSAVTRIAVHLCPYLSTPGPLPRAPLPRTLWIPHAQSSAWPVALGRPVDARHPAAVPPSTPRTTCQEPFPHAPKPRELPYLPPSPLRSSRPECSAANCGMPALPSAKILRYFAVCLGDCSTSSRPSPSWITRPLDCRDSPNYPLASRTGDFLWHSVAWLLCAPSLCLPAAD